MPFKNMPEPQRWHRPEPFCKSREHEPPSMMVIPPGEHTWVCPECGNEQIVIIPERGSLGAAHGVAGRTILQGVTSEFAFGERD